MSSLSQKVWQDPLYFFGYGFGSGLLPCAPGTWGTLAAVPLYLLIASASWGVYLTLTVIAFAIGVVVCGRITKDLGVHDHSGIVWDEVVGYLFTMFLVPFNVFWMILGFILFRIFDIWKPQPIRYIDKHVQSGLGIMLDDLLAAIAAWIILQLLCKFYYG